MRKSILILFFITYLQLGSQAQSFEVKWDQDLTNKPDVDCQLIGEDSATNALYFLSLEKGTYSIQKFDSAHKVIFDRKIDFSTLKSLNGQSFTIVRTGQLKDRFIILACAYSKESTDTRIFIQDISFEGVFISPVKQLAEITSKKKAFGHLSVSPNAGTFAIVLETPKQKGISKYTYDVRIYDNQLDSLYSGKRHLPVVENTIYQKISISKIVMNNKHEITFTGIKLKTILDGNENFLWSFNPVSDTIKLIKFVVPGGTIQHCGIMLNSSGETVFQGFYKTEKEDKGHYAGYFYGIIDNQSQSVVNLKTPPVSSHIQSPPYSADSYIPGWTVLHKKDGGQVWIFEYIWIKSNNPHFGNLLVLNLNKDGELIYTQSVPKNQSKLLGIFRGTSFFNYYSALCFFDNETNKVSVIFNDNPKNIDIGEKQYASPLTNIDNSLLVCVTIDKSGQMIKKVIKRPENDTMIFSTGLLIKTGDRKYTVAGLKDDIVRLGTLSLTE